MKSRYTFSAGIFALVLLSVGTYIAFLQPVTVQCGHVVDTGTPKIPELSIAARTKAQSVATTLKVVGKVYELVGQPFNVESQKAFQEKFMPVLREVDDPTTLASIAVVCAQIPWPGSAEHVRVDSYFYDCFNLSLNELSKIKGPAAQDSLEDIRHRLHLDGGHSLLWEDAVARQKKLSNDRSKAAE